MIPSFEVKVDGVLIPYRLIQFSGGELHVQLDTSNYIEDTDEAFELNIETLQYPMTLMTELSLLRNALQKVFPITMDYLTLPYVPYGRQDRVCSEGDAFSLEVFAKQLNALEFDKVFITDPHSDVTPALINNCNITTQLDIMILNSRFLDNYSHVVSPDAGAYKKVQGIAGYFDKEVIPCLKTRDTGTGRLSNTVVITQEVKEEVTSIVVLDDICDKGGTFIPLAQKLREAYPNARLDLFVTHGIFAAGTHNLKEHYDNLYCHNLFNKGLEVEVIQ